MALYLKRVNTLILLFAGAVAAAVMAHLAS